MTQVWVFTICICGMFALCLLGVLTGFSTEMELSLDQISVSGNSMGLTAKQRNIHSVKWLNEDEEGKQLYCL